MKRKKLSVKRIVAAAMSAVIVIASVSFSAPSGAVSKSITSSHTASYNGAQVRDTTSASR